MLSVVFQILSICVCISICLFVCLSIYLPTVLPYVIRMYTVIFEVELNLPTESIIHIFCVPATGAGNRHRHRQPAGHRHRQPAPATGTGNKPAPATGHSVPEQRTGNRQQGRGKCQLALSNRTRLRSSDHTFGLSCDRKSKRICTIKTQQRNRKDINRYPKKDR